MTPHYTRDPKHKYTILGQVEYGFITGTRNEEQFLLVGDLDEGLSICFNELGEFKNVDSSIDSNLLESIQRRSIAVLRFWIDDEQTGIADLDVEMETYLVDRSQFSPQEIAMYEEDITGWIADGQFVLWVAGTDFYLDADGMVETS